MECLGAATRGQGGSVFSPKVAGSWKVHTFAGGSSMEGRLYISEWKPRRMQSAVGAHSQERWVKGFLPCGSRHAASVRLMAEHLHLRARWVGTSLEFTGYPRFPAPC